MIKTGEKSEVTAPGIHFKNILILERTLSAFHKYNLCIDCIKSTGNYYQEKSFFLHVDLVCGSDIR